MTSPLLLKNYLIILVNKIIKYSFLITVLSFFQSVMFLENATQEATQRDAQKNQEDLYRLFSVALFHTVATEDMFSHKLKENNIYLLLQKTRKRKKSH